MFEEKRRARVLHVESDRYVFLAMKEVMRFYDFAAIHNVHCLGMAAAARVLESPRHFDLIMTDHSPPRVDAYELIRTVRSLPHRKGTPVLMMASALEGFPPIAAAGADAFLSKPPDMGELKETVERLLSQTPPHAKGPRD